MDSNKKFYGVNNETWGHKWGYSDSGFVVNKDRSVTFTGERYPVCGKRLPNFIPFVEEVLGIEFKAEPKIRELAKSMFLLAKQIRHLWMTSKKRLPR